MADEQAQQNAPYREGVEVWEDQKRLAGNQRLATVVFPNGSIAVLPAVPALQAAVCRGSLEARDELRRLA